MHLFHSAHLRRKILGLGAVALGVTGIGLASASAHSVAAAVAPQQTVMGALIARHPGTLQSGHKVSSSALGQRLFTDATHGFALAFAGTAQYPAATTDGGKTWRTDGPALHIDAAQAPFAVTSIGAANVRTVYAYGGGQTIDTTSDRGKHWYRAIFTGLVMAVVRGSSGHLVAFVDASTSTSPASGVTWQYVSGNGGRTWGYDPKVGGF